MLEKSTTIDNFYKKSLEHAGSEYKNYLNNGGKLTKLHVS
jgi:hypothetical protein